MEKVTEHAKILKLGIPDIHGRTVLQVEHKDQIPVWNFDHNQIIGRLERIYETPGRWLVGDLYLREDEKWKGMVLTAQIFGPSLDPRNISGELKDTVLAHSSEAAWPNMGLQHVVGGFITLPDQRGATT